MNAKEARVLANGLNSEKEKEQYKEIEEVIKKRALGGYLSAFLDKFIESSVKLKLEEKGFSVSSTSHRNEPLTTIKW